MAINKKKVEVFEVKLISDEDYLFENLGRMFL